MSTPDFTSRIPAIFAALAATTPAVAQTNLLANPGFETGDLSGWVSTDSVSALMTIDQSVGTVLPSSGDWFAFLGLETPPLNAIEQTATLPSGAQGIRFKAWFQTEDLGNDGVADSAFFRFVYLDSAAGTLSEEVFGPLLSPNLQWEEFVHETDVPAGCEAVRCSIEGVLAEGSFLNVFIDDVELVAVFCTGDIADDFGSLGSDGMVSFGDFLALLGLIGPCPGGTPGCTGDIADDFGTLLQQGDGMVSFGDFLALLGLIGPCP